MGLSAVAIIAGAIMRFAVSVQTTGFNINKIGVILMITMNIFRPAFFRGETLRRDSPTLVTEDFLAQPVDTNA